MKMGKITNSKNWDEAETLRVISLYLFFVHLYQTGQDYHGMKSANYKPLAESLNRTVPSVEQKLMNITGVLKDSKFLTDITLEHRGYKALQGYSADLPDLVYQAFIDAGQIDASDNLLPLYMVEKKQA